MRRMLAVGLAVLFLTGAGFQVQAGESGSGYYDLGVFAYEAGDYQEAEGNFKKALKADPENPVYLHNLGRVYLKTGQYEDAGEYLETARDKDPDLAGLNYDLGLLYYKAENYGMASEHFTAAFDEDSSNVLAAYYGGICLYRQKRYDEAGPLFVTAADKSPSLKVNGYYYAGICDYHSGKTAAAEEKFTYVKENAESPTEKENAEKWLAILGEKGKLKPYGLDFTLKFIYDDNVPLEPTGQDLFPSDEADTGIYGYAGGYYNIVNRSDLVLGAGIGRGQTWYSDLSQFNMSDTNADIYGSYSTRSFLFGLNYLPRLYTIDDEDYLLQHQIRPAVYWQPNRDLLTRFVYAYYLKDYRLNDDRDGDLHDIYADIYYHIFGGRGFVFGGLGYESNSADDDVYNYNRAKVKTGLSVDVGWKVRIDLELYYYQKTYPNFPGSTREDDKYTGVVSIKRPIYREWLFVSLDYNHITNSSNEELFDYRRNTVGVGIDVEF